MIKLFQAQALSNKKVLFHKGKSLFVILPIAIMFAIIVFAASEAANIITVAHDAIFSPIQGQNVVIELSKTSSLRPIDLLSGSTATGYTAADTTTVTSIDNVVSASLQSTLPLENVATTTLFDGKKITISKLSGIDAQYAALYTDQSFTYAEGQPIPIVLNANDFVEVYEDWQGQTEISVEFAQGQGRQTTASINGPVKARAITYARDELMGKTFTMTIGGLSDLTPYKQETTATGIKYIKKTDTELQTELDSRKVKIATYWNYEKIATPLTYTFVIVGVSEGSDKTTAYIPSAFATKLLSDYFTNEKETRNTTAMPSADMNVTYVGLVYDGVTLQQDTTSTLFAGLRNSVTDQVKNQFNSINNQIDAQNQNIRNINVQIDRIHSGSAPLGMGKVGTIGSLDASAIKLGFPTKATSFTIPGLVYQKDRTTNAMTGEYRSFDLTTALPLVSNSMLIQVANTDIREQVVTDLNAKGYNYQDFSKYKQFSTLENYLSTILNIGSIVFMVITALFVLVNMAKFVSESKKEIGIFRAIGATKGDISQLFLLQSLSYIVLSIALGLAVGAVSVLSVENIMVSSTQQFIKSTVGTTINLAGHIAIQDFMSLDIKMIGLYAIGLVVITLLVSLIPARQAANVSPVEAIRNS